MKACPVPLCGARKKPRMLMCAPCWRRVPMKLRKAFYAAARQLGSQHGDRPFVNGMGRVARIRAYQEARDAVIAASAAAR